MVKSYTKQLLEALAFLKKHISHLLPHIAPYVDGFNHDLCDAAISAHTTFLHSQNEVKLYGDPEEGTICLPFLDRVSCTG